jgi:hypothetical protein
MGRSRKPGRKTSSGEPAAARVLPAKIPQPHGGALYAGGVPGNEGGGRRPMTLRQRLAVSLEKRIPILEQIADGEAIVRMRTPEGEESETLVSAAIGDRLKAIDTMGRYGPGTVRELSTDEVRERLRETLAIIRRALPEPAAVEVITQLREVWQ